MDKKILCVCRSGYNRSVETKKELNRRGYQDVLDVGGLIVSKDTLNILCEWADIILLAKPIHGKNIKQEYRKKIKTDYFMGDDLIITAKKQLDKIGL